MARGQAGALAGRLQARADNSVHAVFQGAARGAGGERFYGALEAALARMLISFLRIVPVPTFARALPAAVAAARVRLNAMKARTSRAVFAVETPEGRCAKVLSLRSAFTFSMTALPPVGFVRAGDHAGDQRGRRAAPALHPCPWERTAIRRPGTAGPAYSRSLFNPGCSIAVLLPEVTSAKTSRFCHAYNPTVSLLGRSDSERPSCGPAEAIHGKTRFRDMGESSFLADSPRLSPGSWAVTRKAVGY